ncbi:MAG: hypothetical protein WCI05_04450, partial [Myxococcales bacterium]
WGAEAVDRTCGFQDGFGLRAAVSSLVVREVEGDLASAVALAADRLRALGGKKRLIVLTDGALADPKPLVAAGVDVQEDNAAIVRIDVRAGLDPSTKREQVQVFAMLRNYGARPRDTFVTVAIAGASSGARGCGAVTYGRATASGGPCGDAVGHCRGTRDVVS